ncbi:MAG: tetratricopeptide repeat protein [Blastocatellia bacterium]
MNFQTSLFIILLTTIFYVAPFSFAQQADTAAAHHERGVEYHQRRCLDDASREYAEALRLDPPRELTAEEWALVRRFAPRAYTTPNEFFPLKDFAAILHPTERLIAYHFFWEDDIDFPEDNDPCDHEVVWVQFSDDRRTIEQVWTYFHGRILAGGEVALGEARQHAMRPRINVQWGKHGSLLAGWEQMAIVATGGDAERNYYPLNHPITLKQYQEGTYRKLTEEGRRLADHPIGVRLGWPRKFTGTWNDFTNFSRLIDTRLWLNKSKLARVTRWNNATINQYFLPYNFRPKTEWPR